MKLLFEPAFVAGRQVAEFGWPNGCGFHDKRFAVGIELVSHGQRAPIELSVRTHSNIYGKK
jgi:hypothetical protein